MDLRKRLKKNCNSCGNEYTGFALFKNNKKRCETCMLNFCTSCMFTTTAPRKCRRCLIFNTNPLTKEGLNSLRVRDLKWFLARRNISSETYSEKRELVDLIILTVRRPSTQSNHEQEARYSSGRGNNPSTNPAYSDFRNISERSSFSEPLHSSSVPTSPSRVYPDLNIPQEQNNDPPPTNQNQNTEQNNSPPASPSQQRSNLTSTTAASTPNLSSGEASSKFQPFSLDDITEESEISGLPVRQLKIILARNYVDFRGCIEREELVQKTIRLWNDHQTKQKYIQENEDNLEIDADACKICMVRPIDCVLLECGHMVTCTDCGKVLPECKFHCFHLVIFLMIFFQGPICRQFVSRVVHVFKS